MHSAMIDRAEFPVQRKRTFKGGLLLTICYGGFSSSRGTTAGLGGRDQRPAKLGLPATTILHQEGEKVARSLKIDEIDDRAAYFPRGHKTGPGEDAKMEGERVLRQLEPPRDIARRHAVRPALHEQTKDL